MKIKFISLYFEGKVKQKILYINGKRFLTLKCKTKNL